LSKRDKTDLLDSDFQSDKVVSAVRLKQIVQNARKADKKVVWTNGCYDLMHAGHIIYLEKARAVGDLLVVGLNSDKSVQLSKGKARPIVPQELRARVLSALSCVDYVVLFEDMSPYAIIEYLQPDIYAKGGDYTIDTIDQDERRLVEGYGGDIALFPGVEGMSTTVLIQKILKIYRDQPE